MIFRPKKTSDEQAAATAAAATPGARANVAAAAQASAGRQGPSSSAPAASEAGGASPEEAQRRVAAIRHSVAFAQTVALLMHSPHYKHYTLADLEWLVIPPLVSGQFSVAEAKLKDSGVPVPVAVALWASVSPEVDQRLSELAAAGQPMRLRPDEWRSGDILWLIDAVGDGRVVPGLLQQMGETIFKGREVKVRARGKDGKPEIKTLPLVNKKSGT